MNAIGLVLFALWIGLLLAVSGWLLERMLTNLRIPIRWVWIGGALILSVWLPVAAFVPSSRDRGASAPPTGADSITLLQRSVPMEGRTAGGDEEAAAAFEVLYGWWTDAGQVLISGTRFFPSAEVSPAWIMGVWSVASTLVALIFGVSLLGLLKRARRWPEEILLGQPVKVSPQTGPATVGFLTPRIVMPRWAQALPEHELELILRHEQEHVRSRDTLLLAAGLAALVVCPWNPLVWWKVRRLRGAVEVDCDRRVLREGFQSAAYGKLLVKLGTRGWFPSLAAPTMAGSTSLLERRLTLMKRPKRRPSIRSVLATGSVALLLLAIACSSEAPVAAEGSSTASSESASESSDAAASASRNVVTIQVARDGSVRVNGADQPMEQISEVVASLNRDSTIAWIEADAWVPYAIVSNVQAELIEAGLLRVNFAAIEQPGVPSSPRDPSTLVDGGLPVVLPETTDQVDSALSNLLYFYVQPSGWVIVRRGESRGEQKIQRNQVSFVLRHSLEENAGTIAIVRIDPEAEYRYMHEVLAAVRRTDATRFSLQEGRP